MAKVHDEPSKLTPENGHVLVDGPDGVAVTLTPEAAAETSDRLLHGAMHAEGQAIAVRRRDEEQRARRN